MNIQRILSFAVLTLFGICSDVSASAAEKRPNILFAIADDWSYGHAGAYGCKWVKTPAFDRVASQGILFTHAYTPNAKCAPSRACILTGRNSWQLKAAANHYCYFPTEFKTYPEALSGNGYFVGMTGKGWGPGVATNANGGTREMAGKPFVEQHADRPTKGISNNDYAANFSAFLHAAPKDKPWCFWYGGFEPHRPYEFESGMNKGGKNLTDIDRLPGFWPDAEVVRKDMLDYAFEVEHFDRHLGRMLQMLEASGQLSNTIVIVTSDNGMPFPRDKGQCYEQSNHMPLAIMWPERIRHPGRKVDDYVSFIDFAPTFLEISGVRESRSGMASITGHSLTEIFASAKSGRVTSTRDHLLIGKERHDVGRPNDWGFPIRGILKDDMLYLKNFEPTRWPAGNPETGYLETDGGPTKTKILNMHRKNPSDTNWALCFGMHAPTELYDLRKDSDCIVNLAGHPEMKSLEAKLDQQLTKELKQQEDPRVFGRGDVFDKYPFSREEVRNFYNRYTSGEKIRPSWVNPNDFEN